MLMLYALVQASPAPGPGGEALDQFHVAGPVHSGCGGWHHHHDDDNDDDDYNDDDARWEYCSTPMSSTSSTTRGSPSTPQSTS